MAKIYALYKGDEYVTDGTLDEIAEKTGLQKSSLRRMKEPSKKNKRSSLVCIGEEEQTCKCEACGKVFCTNNPKKKYCSKICCKRANNRKQARNSVVRLELPYKRHKPKYASHIVEINAQARAQHKSYGQLQAEKLLARLHEEMN